ncbi:MAG: autotransporter outer membrane beta-barrel domain-containing protein, partial [Opitutaceae bacterium]|nr:autotransporter outer membrane beta-barrel domain-containing protein [Opitutaceae bacterium]
LASLNREIIFAASASGTGGGGSGTGGAAAPALELGDGFTTARAIELRTDGEIAVAAGGTATLAGAITGTAAAGGATATTLTKTGAGALVIAAPAASAPGGAAAAPAYAIAAGSLWGDAGTLTGAIRIDAAGTLVLAQHTDAALAATAVITGPGAFEKRGAATLTLNRALAHSGPTRVLAGVLKAGAAGVFSASSAHNVAAGAALDLGGFNQTVAALDLAAGAAVILDAAFNPAAGICTSGNELTVTGALTGAGAVLVRLDALSTGTAAAGGAADPGKRKLLTFGPGSDTSGLKAGFSERVVDSIYDIVPRIDSAAGAIFLDTAMVSPEVPAATAIPAVSLLMGRAGLDSAAHRLGELRGGGERPDGVWARGLYREDRVTNGFFDGMRVRAYGIQAGVDHAASGVWGENSRLVLGAFFDALDSDDNRPAPGADLDARQRSFGVYGLLAKGVWHVEAVARLERNKYDLSAPGDTMRMKGNGFAAALETGCVFRFLGRVEPSVRFVCQDQSDYDSSDNFGRDYNFKAAGAFEAGGGIRWSTNIPFDTHSSVAPWLRVSGGRGFGARQKIGITGSGGRRVYWFDNDLGGSFFALEGGATLLLGRRASLYASGMWGHGGSIDSASAGAGLRFSW